MNDSKGPKADGLNSAEIREAVMTRAGGGTPLYRSIRKRGFHRALKRGESWAVMMYLMNKMYRDFESQLLAPNPFTTLIDNEMEGLSQSISITYGLPPKDGDK